MLKELSIQAFSVRDNLLTAQDAADTFKKLASYGFTGVQTAGVPAYGFEEYGRLAKEAGLRIIGTHLSLDFHEDLEKSVPLHNMLGTTNCGIGCMPNWNAPEFGAEKLNEFITRANALGEKLSKYGMKFTYHNHSFEFSKIKGERIMDILVREFDPKTVSFVLDTYWLQHGGGNVLEWIEKLAGRVDILHLKDKGVPFGGTMDGVITELGAGNLNFRDILRVAEDTGVKEYCYEQDGNFRVSALESAKESAQYYFDLVASM